MVYIAFMLIILLPTIAGFGGIFKKIFGNIFGGISSVLLLGVVCVALLFTTSAFFIPLNIFVEVATIFLGLSAFFFFKLHLPFWDFFTKVPPLFYGILLIIILFTSFYPFILDHFGYYVPTIKWISEVGLVQGISNLDLLLGQTSIWHVFQAGFSNFSDPFLRINVFMLIVFLIYIFEKKSWILLIFLPFLFLFSQSPSADLPVIALSLVLLNEFFAQNKNSGLLFTVSVFVFAIKPTMIWLPIFAFFYGLMSSRTNFKFILPGIFVFLLFMMKNIYTFGFPIFPVQIFDFGFSWKPNSELLHNSSKMAILKTYDMQFSFAEIQQFSRLDAMKNWLFLEGIKGKIHLSFIFSLLLFFIYSIKKKSKIIWILFISILMKSILVLLFSAQYRFFLEVFFVIFFVLFYEIFSKKISLFIFALLSSFFFIFLSFPHTVKTHLPSFKLGNFMTGFNVNQFYKPSYFTLKKYKTHQLGNLKFNVAKNYPFSFDTPLPAISPEFIQEDLDAGIFPQLQGKTLKEGFVWRKISVEEKQKLIIILKDFK